MRETGLFRAFLAATFLVAAVSPALAGHVTYLDDRTGFAAALTVNPGSSLVDTGNSFGTDPIATTYTSGLARSGLVSGFAFAYTAYHMDFSNSPTGAINPGSTGGDAGTYRSLRVEKPVVQDSATGSGTWGIDEGSGGTTTRNALLIDFSTTPGGNGVGHFGADLHDFEAFGGTGGTRGLLRVYQSGTLSFSTPFDWGTQTGDQESHFLGVTATSTSDYFDQVVLVIGEDGVGSGANFNHLAADRLTFGQAYEIQPIPEPGTLALLSLGAGALFIAVRRRRRPVA